MNNRRPLWEAHPMGFTFIAAQKAESSYVIF